MNDSKSKAIAIIRAEHRALGAVINNIKALLQEVQAGRMAMDFKLFWAMVYYIDAFPDRLHHPKEDDWLFARLAARTPLADSLIEALQSQHQAEPQALAQMRRELGNLEAGVAGSLQALQATVADYADFTWKPCVPKRTNSCHWPKPICWPPTGMPLPTLFRRMQTP